MEKNRQIFIDAEEIMAEFKMTEDDPHTRAAVALISHAMNLGHDGDIENKCIKAFALGCIKAFALGMAFERIGGEE